MISKRDIRYRRDARLAVVKGILFGFVGLVSALSLLVYSPEHQSLFYIASDAIPADSIIEYILFQWAPILLFFFGAGAVPLCLFWIDCAWKNFKNRNFFEDRDQTIASIILIAFTACCASALQADLFSRVNPGGLVGQGILFVVRKLVGIRFEKALVIIVLALCALIVARHATVWCVRYIISFVNYIASCTKLWRAMYRFGMFGYTTVTGFFLWIFNSLYAVMTGTVFEKNERDFVEITYGLQEVAPDNHHQGVLFDFEPAIAQQAVVDINPKPVAEKKKSNPEQIVNMEQSEMSEQAQNASGYCAPNLDIFIAEKEHLDDKSITKELEHRARLLEQKLERFGVSGRVTAIKRGPVVTVFEYQPSIDSKISKIIALEDDLALALQALSIRIIAPIPGTNVVGFEVANSTRKSVQFGSIIRSEVFTKSSIQLPLVIGQDTLANPIVVDLARMPHLLVAGSTGSGKSVALNGMLTSLLCRCSPQDMRLVLVDPKRLEFAPYAGIGHLMFPIVTDVKKVAPVLRYIIHEMEQRYELMAQKGARNIFDFHAQFGQSTLPFIVVIIDELADLMMTVGKDVEDLITRIAQMARAAGIHMIIATQRPSVDVITGLIKVNFPSRISFRVTSKIDSRTILDATGAEKLLGKGDMLFLDASSGQGLKRAHGAYVSDKEIQTIVAHIRSQGEPNYIDESILNEAAQDSGEPLDTMIPEVMIFLDTIDEVSISLLQRKFRIGYNRSARIMEQLEQQGRILPSNGGKMRKVVH